MNFEKFYEFFLKYIETFIHILYQFWFWLYRTYNIWYFYTMYIVWQIDIYKMVGKRA